MRYLIAIGLVLVSSSVYAKAHKKLVEVPLSAVKAMTPAEKKAALAYARANGIRWRILKDR